MISNSLIVIPSNVPWNWSTDYINQTARILCKTNTVICFFWLNSRSIKEHVIDHRSDPIFFKHIERRVIGYYAIHFLPFRRFQFIYQTNLFINIQIVQLYTFLLSLHCHFRKRVLWFFDPICYPILTLFSKKWFRIYDCIDYFRGSSLLSEKKKEELIDNEQELIRIADLVTVNSKTLYKLHSSVRKDVHIVPQGFCLDEFNKSTSSVLLPKGKPIIGYVGAINYRLDYHLLVKLAKRLPNCRFVFVGPLQRENPIYRLEWETYAQNHLFSLPNVTVIYGVDKKKLKYIIEQFSICIIPYLESIDFNKYCYPMKLFEYFYVGKPVVSTPIEEQRYFPEFVKIGKTADDWEDHILRLINKSWPTGYIEKQRKLALLNSWGKKIKRVSKFIQ